MTTKDYEEKADQEEKPDNNNDKRKYVGSAESDKYHRLTYRWVKNIEQENKIWFSSVSEAKTNGYKPCGTCKPPS